MEPSNGKFNEMLTKIHDELSSGLLYTHTHINDNTRKTLESTSFLYTLIELLNDKRHISIEELDERKKQVAQRLVKKFTESSEFNLTEYEGKAIMVTGYVDSDWIYEAAAIDRASEELRNA